MLKTLLNGTTSLGLRLNLYQIMIENINVGFYINRYGYQSLFGIGLRKLIKNILVPVRFIKWI